MGNEARFVNDYRGVSSKPNAVFLDQRSPNGDLKICIWSSNREIRKGEEILVSYGKSWWQARSEETEKTQAQLLQSAVSTHTVCSVFPGELAVENP